MDTTNPILNSPYSEPLLHYDTDKEGDPDYKNQVKLEKLKKSFGTIKSTIVILLDELRRENLYNEEMNND